MRQTFFELYRGHEAHQPTTETTMTHKVISRQDARAAGLSVFYTGAQCIHGHLAPRRVDNWACTECAANWRKTSAKPENRMLRVGVKTTRTIELRIDTSTDALTNDIKTKLKSLCGREVSGSVLHRAGLSLLADRLDHIKDGYAALELVA